MKVRRRTPAPDPDGRLRALARLHAAAAGAVRRDEQLGSDEEVRGGWIPETAVPERLRASNWTLAPRHIAVLTVILVLGLAWAAWSVFHSRPEVIPDAHPSPPSAIGGSPVAQPSTSTSAIPQPSTSGSPGTSPASQEVVVDVAGKVRRPGLVRAAPGSRVADVLLLAGGALPGVDLTSLNLARQVSDGEQILVGIPGAPPPPAATPGPGGTSPANPTSTPVDLNKATLADLESLPGVGPVLAQRILDWRTEHGHFTTIDELQEVTGVGEKKFESLKPHVHV
ncbi:helix-hairpin-helix domain-containing protein [Kribbella monticola]|uniref:helix-hairpin-helix domain-containing protein n=1 Tax=Kribbella monticola TaxID=2185285 RepID=UPI001E2E787B|nr:ComEA family DNA-binding protein [Kribbella monticola]